MKLERRAFLKNLSGITIGASVFPLINFELIDRIEEATNSVAHLHPKTLAQDEEYWSTIQKAFHLSSDFINLENGYFSPMATEVLEAQLTNIRMINEAPSFYMRRKQSDDRTRIKKLLAEFAGCLPEEIVITRNTTESLDTIISGLDLKQDDEAIMTSQDYGSMLAAFKQQAKRNGVVNKIISLPLHPKNKQEIVSAFEDAITHRTKVILVTHIINLTGQILPVREICDMAHTHNVEVIVDAAHSFAHIDFQIPDLHCDYLGTSLHKWLCAPLGTGLMYIRKENIRKVWPLFGDTDFPEEDIRKFEHIGTHPCSSVITIENALRFHNSIGSKRKEERLRYLKNYWVNKAATQPKVALNTPIPDEQSCAIANINIVGKSPTEVAKYLFDKHKIFTVAIETEAVKGVRITPHLYTTLQNLDLLIDAIRELCEGK